MFGMRFGLAVSASLPAAVEIVGEIAKMIAYVGIAPLANAYAARLPRRAFLVALDMARAAIVLLLPFVDQIWQIYLLIFVLQSASAAFTPAFQATIPDILSDEREYTKALSLSRLAYDLESLLSPALAAALLTVTSFHWLFGGTAIGFIVSAGLILSTILPQAQATATDGGIYERMTRGIRIYLATPRLSGLLALNLSAAAAGAMVIVNTVVYVQGIFQRSEADVALALAMFGGGSMLAALALPRMLDRLPDRPVMLSGAALMAAAMLFIGVQSILWSVGWALLLSVWFVLGLGYSAVLTPAGRLLRRSSTPQDRPAVFAAQFALSHACWLLTYPLAGWLGAEAGMTVALVVLGGLSVLGVLLALALWPANDPEVLEHIHRDLAPEHPHLRDAVETGRGLKHTHAFVIDDFHQSWPTRG